MSTHFVEPDDLRRFAIFGRLTAADLAVVDANLRVRDHARGEVIVRHLDHDRDVFLVFAGSLLANQFSVGGREVSYRRIGAGSYFGELAAIDGQPRSVNVVALTHARIGTLPGTVFRDLLDRSPALAHTLLVDMAHRVRDLSGRLFEATAATVPMRVDAELLRLAMTAGVDDNAAVIASPPTHAELAALVGGQREAVTREVGRLIAARLIAKRGKTLEILDVEGLIERLETGGGEIKREA